MLCSEDVAKLVPPGIAILVTPRPQQAFAQIGRLLYPDAASPRSTDRRDRRFEEGPCLARTRMSKQGAIIEAGASDRARARQSAAARSLHRTPYCVQAPRSAATVSSAPNVNIQYALVGNRVIIHGGAQIGQDGFGFVAGRARPGKHSADRTRHHPGRCRNRRQHDRRSGRDEPTPSLARAPRSTIWSRSPTTCGSVAAASLPAIAACPVQ